MKFAFTSALIIFLAVTGYGQENPLPDSTVIKVLEAVQEFEANKKADTIQTTSADNLEAYRNTKIKIPTFDSVEWRKIVAKTDFSETKREAPSQPWLKFNPNFLAPLKYLIWALVFGGVGWLLYILLRNTSWDVKIKKSEFNSHDVTQSIDDINELDLNNLLADAVSTGNYRVAIRIYYLIMLRQLNTSGKITWKKDKTNRDYLAELFAKEFLFKEMRRLTIIYEQVWYGEHVINKTSFEQLKSVFESVQQQLPTA